MTDSDNTRVLKEQDLIDIFSLSIGNLGSEDFDTLVKLLETRIIENIKAEYPGILRSLT